MIEVISRIHKRTKHRLRDNRVLIVGVLCIIAFVTSVALTACPELSWCMIDWRK